MTGSMSELRRQWDNIRQTERQFKTTKMILRREIERMETESLIQHYRDNPYESGLSVAVKITCWVIAGFVFVGAVLALIQAALPD